MVDVNPGPRREAGGRSANPTARECFLLAPTGKPGSQARKRFEAVLQQIIQPGIDQSGGDYRIVRCDEVAPAGGITNEVIRHIIESDLLVVDLSGGDSTVSYGLAVRYAAEKPVIELHDSSREIPAGIANLRTVRFDLADENLVWPTISELAAHIQAIGRESGSPESPLGLAVDSLRARIRSAVAIGTDKHYEAATRLVRQARRSIVLCQRTSTFLLGPERGRRREEDFYAALLDALDRGVTIHHLVHEDSCMADIWEAPRKFNEQLGATPDHDLLFVGRYRGVKPFPRLLIVDEEVMGCVFDIDQTQFYAIIDLPDEVSDVAQHAIRYITDRGQEGFLLNRFLDQLRMARAGSELVHSTLGKNHEHEIFSGYFQKWLQDGAHDPGIRSYLLDTPFGSVTLPLAWPQIRRAVFFDPATTHNESRDREMALMALNAASATGWRVLYLPRTELLLALEETQTRILNFVTDKSY